MYEKILVPLDGSKVGEAALPYVEELMCAFSPEKEVEVTLLQVIAEQTHWVTVPEVAGAATMPYTEAELKQFKKEAMAYLGKVGRSLKKNKGVVVKSTVRVGADVAHEILKASDEVKVDLIAISTHGRSGIGRWAFGSVADRILRGGSTPVLMVRAGKGKLRR